MDLICEDRPSDSPFVESIWRSRSDYVGPFISMAESQTSLVVTKYKGRAFITLRGPATRAMPAFSPEGAEFVGIQLRPGVFIPDFPTTTVTEGHDLSFPEASRDSFWLKSSVWEYPNFENADTFVERLIQNDLLVVDPVVDSVVSGQPVDMSERNIRRRFLRATGLTYGALYQVERARYATALLKEGMPILDATYEAGFFDQPHMTRALKQYIGLTPAQVVDETRRNPLSFLYKKNPLSLNYNTNKYSDLRLE